MGVDDSEDEAVVRQTCRVNSLQVLWPGPLAPTGATSTTVAGISGGNVVGTSFIGGGVHYAYLYDGASYTTIAPTGAVVSAASGISGGNIVGNYETTLNGPSFGFLYDGTSYVTIHVPGSTSTYVAGVSSGDVVGDYVGSNGMTNGFVYNGTT
jgi:hypothetical protein